MLVVDGIESAMPSLFIAPQPQHPALQSAPAPSSAPVDKTNPDGSSKGGNAPSGQSSCSTDHDLLNVVGADGKGGLAKVDGLESKNGVVHVDSLDKDDNKPLLPTVNSRVGSTDTTLLGRRFHFR